MTEAQSEAVKSVSQPRPVDPTPEIEEPEESRGEFRIPTGQLDYLMGQGLTREQAEAKIRSMHGA